MSEDKSFEKIQSKNNNYDYYKILGVDKTANIITDIFTLLYGRQGALLKEFTPLSQGLINSSKGVVL